MLKCRCEACGQYQMVDALLAGQTIACDRCQRNVQVPYPPLELPLEVTPGGSVVQRHEPGMRQWEAAIGDDAHIQRISDHIESHLGPIDTVWHELVSELVHIDVHCIGPTADRPFRTLVTSGMSERPMSAPDEAWDCRFLELMICLPPDWPVSQKDFDDESNYWPVRWLKQLARFPHEYQTWLFDGHTVPNGEPPMALAANNRFTGWLIMPPQLAPDQFQILEIDEQTQIHFAALYPLYEAEMQLKLEAGTEVLFQRLVQHRVTERVDVDRVNVALSDYDGLL